MHRRRGVADTRELGLRLIRDKRRDRMSDMQALHGERPDF